MFYFREIFFVPEDMLIVPKMYTTIPSCRLHVIDNDTLEEMPQVFLKVAPHIYPKNKVNVWSIKIIGIKMIAEFCRHFKLHINVLLRNIAMLIKKFKQTIHITQISSF